MYLYIDIGDFLKQEIKGPAKFSCNSGDCKFEEPAMNDLINQIFGDAYISVRCEGGECLHYSQVPGYVVRWKSFCSYSLLNDLYSVLRNPTQLSGWHSALLVLVYLC